MSEQKLSLDEVFDRHTTKFCMFRLMDFNICINKTDINSYIPSKSALKTSLILTTVKPCQYSNIKVQ